MTIPSYLVLAIAFMIAGCETLNEPVVSTQDVPLQGTTWRLVAFEPAGSLPFLVPPDERYVISFVSDTMFTGHTTVNSSGGPYETDSRTKLLTIPYFVSTKAYGGPNETRYYAALRAAARYAITTERRTKQLRIYYGSSADAIRFRGE